MMEGMADSAQAIRGELEWRILRLLCISADSKWAQREKALELLHPDDFGDLIHCALFEEILRGSERNSSPEELRRWLPAAMTRRGWPDLDFDDLFRVENLDSSRDEFVELLTKLRALVNRTGGAAAK
jgi:hypothetical protein